MASSPKNIAPTRARRESLAASKAPTPKGRRGPPTTYTTEIGDRIVAHVRGGAPLPAASSAVGCIWETVRGWIEKGRRGEEPYVEFAVKLGKARGQFVTDSLDTIASAGPTDWKASAWILERRDKRFQIRTREEVEREVTTIIGVLERELDAKTLERVLGAIIAAREPGAIPIPRLAAVEPESW